MVQLRDEVMEIPAYKQGAIPDSDAVKLSSNENPYPPLPSVREAVARCLDTINRYPQMTAPDLVARIARHVGVDEDCIALGSGSVEVAGQLASATSGPGDEVVYPWPSFSAYPTLARIAGATPVPVPLTADDGHDLDAMAAAVTDRTSLVIVCNPNNPTSTSISATELEEFLAKIPERVLVVVDEAYLHFNRRPDTAQGIEAFRTHSNVAVLHTFSKAYGLAGLRVGYAVARPDVAGALRRVATPFGVTDLAQHAAIASLDAEDELAERVETILAERSRMEKALGDAGVPFARSDANFLWLRTGEKTPAVNDVLTRNGVLARATGTQGLRVTVGTPEENDRVLAVADELAAAAG